jgi:hypothetical protein
VTLLALTAPASAFAQEQDWRGHALAETQAASPRDQAAIHSIMDAQAGSGARGIAGNWRCRSLKLGGMTPAMVYGWFHCRIWDQGGALRFEKVTGSQRMLATLTPQGNGYSYRGASSAKGEPLHQNSGGGASVGASRTPDDQEGFLEILADGRARIEIPHPIQESDYDVIELRR